MSAVDEGLDLMPPGPDYLLLSVKYSRGYTRYSIGYSNVLA